MSSFLMYFFKEIHSKNVSFELVRQKGNLRIIGAISRDLNGIPNGRRPDEIDEEAQNHVN